MHRIIILFLFVSALKAQAFEHPKFLMGAANSSFQVEGSPVDSNWKRWTRIKGKIDHDANADRATDFLNRYPEDFGLAKNIGLNAFRISIAWERVHTQEGTFSEEALKPYEEMILELRKQGMEPVVTLFHFTIPGWLDDQGGVLSKNFPKHFAEYSKFVMEHFSKAPFSVKYWNTINEPTVFCIAGYQEASWPPGKSDLKSYFKCVGKMAEAHLQATLSLSDDLWNRLQVSIAHHWGVIHPAHPSNPMLVEFSKIADDLFNLQFMESILTGKIKVGHPLLGEYKNTIKIRPHFKSIHYMGVNYYKRGRLTITLKPPFLTLLEGDKEPKSDLGWEIDALLFEASLKRIYSLYQLPILITENGVADSTDRIRPYFLHSHLQALDRVIDSNIPVIGYLHWSLTDNFEWAHGLWPRFGLIEVDYKTLQRKPRTSYFEYGKLVNVFYSKWNDKLLESQ